MYDASVDSSAIVYNEYPTWDLKVVDGVCPLISGDNEEQQRAMVTAFLQYGTIPQLPEDGVDWTGFFTKKLNFGDLDVAIRQDLISAGLEDFDPSYEINGEDFVTVIKRSEP